MSPRDPIDMLVGLSNFDAGQAGAFAPDLTLVGVDGHALGRTAGQTILQRLSRQMPGPQARAMQFAIVKNGST